MKATELIGKTAIRTTYATHPNGIQDNSYTDTPIKIEKATDSHIIYTFLKEDFCYNSGKLYILNHDFCDNNWIDYDELISGIEPVTITVTEEE